MILTVDLKKLDLNKVEEGRLFVTPDPDYRYKNGQHLPRRIEMTITSHAEFGVAHRYEGRISLFGSSYQAVVQYYATKVIYAQMTVYIDDAPGH